MPEPKKKEYKWPFVPPDETHPFGSIAPFGTAEQWRNFIRGTGSGIGRGVTGALDVFNPFTPLPPFRTGGIQSYTPPLGTPITMGALPIPSQTMATTKGMTAEDYYIKVVTEILDDMLKTGEIPNEKAYNAKLGGVMRQLSIEGLNSSLPYYETVAVTQMTPEDKKAYFSSKENAPARQQFLIDTIGGITSAKKPTIPEGNFTSEEKIILQRAISEEKVRRGQLEAKAAEAQFQAREGGTTDFYAEQRNMGKGVTVDPELLQKLATQIAEAQQLGIKTSGYEQALQKAAEGFQGQGASSPQAIKLRQTLSRIKNPETKKEFSKLLSGMGDKETAFDPEQYIGNQMVALNAQIKAVQARTQREEGSLLAFEYPEWFKKFQAEYQVGRARFQEDIPKAVTTDMATASDLFSSWENPAFQEAVTSGMASRIKQFPRLFPLFQEQPIEERKKGFYPWVQENPFARVAYENRINELTRPRTVNTPRWLPAGR